MHHDATNDTPPLTIIARKPGVCGGRPAILGTRIEPRTLLDLWPFVAGVDELRQCYPHLMEHEVEAGLAYARAERSVA